MKGLITIMVNRLREVREAQGLSLEKVAEIIGCTSKTLSNYETGRTDKIPYEIVEKLSQLYKVSPRFLIQIGEKE